MKKLKNFIRNNKAATAIEYGLIAALIAIGLITALSLIGDELEVTFDKAGSALETANDANP